MTREELIEILCNDTSEVTCSGNCDLPEEEGNTGECCRKCAERLLESYEAELMAETASVLQHDIDYMKDKIGDLHRQLAMYECKWSVVEMIFKK